MPASSEITGVEVSPALNINALAVGLADLMLSLRVMAVKKGIALLKCQTPGG